MKSEFQFLMAPADEMEFEGFLSSLQLTIEAGKGYDLIRVGDGAIQFIRSKLSGGVLMSGRIAASTDDPEVERIYKKLRAWLKKRYVNDLVAFQLSDPENSSPVKFVWLGPCASRLLNDGAVMLVNFAASNVGFVRASPHNSLQASTKGSSGSE